MTIKIIGTGCPSCKQLYKMVQETVEELKTKCEIEYLTDIQKMVKLGVMQTPALMIDDEIVASGYIPTNRDLKEFIKKYSDQ